MMSLTQFLNPDDENIEDDTTMVEPDIDELIARHTGQIEEVDKIEDELVELPPIPSAQEALQAIALVQRFKAHQISSTPSEIRSLRQVQRSIELQAFNSQRQGTLDSWIS
jgi:hypothetical protein